MLDSLEDFHNDFADLKNAIEALRQHPTKDTARAAVQQARKTNLSLFMALFAGDIPDYHPHLHDFLTTVQSCGQLLPQPDGDKHIEAMHGHVFRLCNYAQYALQSGVDGPDFLHYINTIIKQGSQREAPPPQFP